MSYQLVVTNVGLTKLANANIEGTQLQLTQFGVGDGVITPDPSMTALESEQYIGDINRIETTDGVIIADLVVPDTVGGWFIREAGIYDADGDLFAIANVPVTYKVAPAEGSAKSVQIRLRIAISDTNLISFSTDESVVYATQLWVGDITGDLSDLLTTAKDNLVNAVNELSVQINNIPSNWVLKWSGSVSIDSDFNGSIPELDSWGEGKYILIVDTYAILVHNTHETAKRYTTSFGSDAILFNIYVSPYNSKPYGGKRSLVDGTSLGYPTMTAIYKWE